MERKVDILLPVDNSLENLKQCISSILEYTNLNSNRLVIISNQSTDSSIKSFVNSLHQDGIYKFEEKKAFDVASVLSIGKNFSETNDVILLYPNTIVTANWVEKLKRCADSAEEIGIVSPITNLFINSGDKDYYTLPHDSSIDEYASHLEEISLWQHPGLTPDNASCAFIKRATLNDVIARKSEKTDSVSASIKDFIKQSFQLGYSYVLCDTTFVYCNKIDNTLITAPKCIEDKAGSLIEKNIELYNKLEWWNGKKNIFYLVQADFREECSNNIGGTQLHVKDLVMELKQEFNLFVAARDGEFLRVTAYIDKKNVPLSFHIGAVPEYFTYRSNKLGELFSDLLMAFHIDLVHIHHTMGLTLELYYSAKKANIPVYTTLHDYYFICPTLRLLDANNKPCIGVDDVNKCSKCLRKYMNISKDIDFIQKWRKEYGKVLEISEKIFVPSKAATNIILQYYPEIEDKVQIIPHGIDTQLFYRGNSAMPYQHKQLHIAFVGGISEVKGASTIYKIITQNKNSFKWFIFGGIGTTELFQLEQKNLTKTGWYKKEELKNLLQQYEIDIVCLLSMVEETYCYTLSEVVACGVPVIATDIGALGERTKEMKCGWLVSPEVTAETFLGVLQQIQNDPLEYEKKYNTVKETKARTNAQMADDYRNIYEKQRKGTIKYMAFNSMHIVEGYFSVAHTDNSDLQALMSRNQYLEQELSVICGSNIFQYMQRIAKFADKVKGLLKFGRS